MRKGRFSRWWLLPGVVVLIALVVGLSQAGGDSDDAGDAGSSTAQEGPFVVNWSFAPASLDPAETTTPSENLSLSLYVTLTKYGTKPGDDGFPVVDFEKVEPYLAESWESEDDGKTWIFKLRDDAEFSDGSPMDAEAVKYSLERILTRGGTPSFVLQGNTPGLVTGIEAPDPTTVIIRLSDPYPRFAEVMTSPQASSIVNPKVVEANGGVSKDKPNEWMATNAAGGGPYVLESYDPGQRIVMKANPRFFGEEPVEKRVIVNFITSDSTLLLQAKSGQAHVTVGLTSQSIASLEGDSCCQVVASPFNYNSFISLPTKTPPFDDKVFRQGLSYAVPYEDIVEEVMHGYARSHYGPFPPGNTNFNPELGKTRAFDIDQAKDLIEQSGADLPVKLDLLVPEGNLDYAGVATILKDTWRDIGVNVNIRTLSEGPFVKALTGQKKDYAMMGGPWGGTFGFPYWVTNYLERCGHAFNISEYCNRDISRLIDEAFLAPEDEEQALWDELTRLWIEEAPRIPIYSPDVVVVLKKGVSKYEAHAVPFAIRTWGR